MIVALLILSMLNMMILGGGVWFIWKKGKEVLTRLVDEHVAQYEQRVHQQSLAEARRLLDANRTYPARPDAGPPARVHKARAGKVMRKTR